MTAKELRAGYRRERKRIQSYLRYRRKAGFISSFEISKIPKRITPGSIRRLQKITPSVLKEYEYMFVSPETGEVIEGEHWKLTKAYRTELKERRKIKLAAKISSQPATKERSRVIISNFFSDASHFPNSAYPVITEFLRRLREDYTDDEIAEMLEESAQQGERLTYEIAYKSEALLSWLSDRFPGNTRLMDDMEDFVFENDYYDYERSSY